MACRTSLIRATRLRPLLPAVEVQILNHWTTSEVLVMQSCPTLLRSPWTIAHQVPLFMEVSKQECWSGLSFPSPGGLPNPGTTREVPNWFFGIWPQFSSFNRIKYVEINLKDLFIYGSSGSSLLHRLSLVAVSKGYSLLQWAGFSLQWLFLLESMDSRMLGLL